MSNNNIPISPNFPSSINQSKSSETQDTEKTLDRVSQKKSMNNTSLMDKTVITDLGRNLLIANKICSGTGTSDKFVRLTGSIIKILKNFKIIEAKRYDKLSMQIGNLRRLLRLNRLGTVLKDWRNFIIKEDKKPREIFDSCFKIIMFLTDLSDTIMYLMQQKVFKEYKVGQLKKIVADFYFYECLIWLWVHTYQLIFHKSKYKSDQERRNKKLLILKYILDGLTSHNDWSKRCTALDIKATSAIGLLSSLLGLYMIWK